VAEGGAQVPFLFMWRLVRMETNMQTMAVLLHASLDPYNTTEEMELTWSEVVMDWTNAKFVFKVRNRGVFHQSIDGLFCVG